MIRSASSQASTSSTAAHEDALERVLDDLRQADLLGCRLGLVAEQVVPEGVTGQRPDQEGAALLHVTLQGVGVLDVLLDDVLVELVDRDVESAVGDEAVAALDRVDTAGIQRDELVVQLEVGEVERVGPLHRLERGLQRPLQIGHHCLELRLGRSAGRSRPP